MTSKRRSRIRSRKGCSGAFRSNRPIVVVTAIGSLSRTESSETQAAAQVYTTDGGRHGGWRAGGGGRGSGCRQHLTVVAPCRTGIYPLHCARQPIAAAVQTMRRRATYAAAEDGVRES